MLLFIYISPFQHSLSFLFKYISCYCLSDGRLKQKRKVKRIQIHLMLLFIFSRLSSSIIANLFKYISCYCLSWNIATHHLFYLVFKYISCYCLSCNIVQILGTNKPFKYISCYCLSCVSRRCSCNNRIQIHLMLLFILLFK